MLDRILGELIYRALCNPEQSHSQTLKGGLRVAMKFNGEYLSIACWRYRVPVSETEAKIIMRHLPIEGEWRRGQQDQWFYISATWC